MARFPIALPRGHFMGLAPLDVWARLLWGARFRIGPRYWLRLVCAVGTSALATVVTLPERVVLWPVLKARFGGRAPTFVPQRDAIIVLGYFRSGTTHLQNLLATHPDTVTPRWVQAISPQGFWVSWAFLRWALVPFLPNRRPMDDVAFGPEWPAEDDFAHNNWALASSLSSRLVVPRERERWGRFHALKGLSEGELARWRRVMAGFAWKVSCGARGKALLLKSPSHTARVRELDRLFGGRVRFVHITRSPEDVVRSNMGMYGRLEGQMLQAQLGGEALREMIVREYVESERGFLEAAEGMGLAGAGRLVRVRYDDLVAQPIPELRRICAGLGLRWDDEAAAPMTRYLGSIGEYRARTRPQENSDPRLVELERDLLRGIEPAAADSGGLAPAPVEPARRGARGVLAAWLCAGACLALWLGAAGISERRLDIAAWILGGVIGAVTLRVAGRGDWRLGLWAAAATLAMIAASVWPLPEVAHGWTGPDRLGNIRTTYGSLNNNSMWALFGVLSAYRYASRRFLKPPGM